MLKPDNVKIVSISIRDIAIMGLGDDNMVYRWMAESHVWHLDGTEEEKTL
jgi:hypothetical protein